MGLPRTDRASFDSVRAPRISSARRRARSRRSDSPGPHPYERVPTRGGHGSGVEKVRADAIKLRDTPRMTVGWNFERRRDTCSRFLIGVSFLTEGIAERDTSLEAVRSRMRLSPEEALFAARRLLDENLIGFEAGGAVRSTGPVRASALMASVRTKMGRYDDMARVLAAGGTPVAVLAAVIRFDGGALACGAPDAAEDGTHRLVLVGDEVALERRLADGTFAAVQIG